MLFGTFAAETEPLEAYLGEFGTGMIRRFMHKPDPHPRLLAADGRGNWKLYAENLRDTYHASLLHEFFVTYGVDRATQKGGVKMDARHRHNMNHAYAATDTQEDARPPTPPDRRHAGPHAAARPVAAQVPARVPDGMNLAAPTFFPNILLIQINNTLGTRQIRPKGARRVRDLPDALRLRRRRRGR